MYQKKILIKNNPVSSYLINFVKAGPATIFMQCKQKIYALYFYLCCVLYQFSTPNSIFHKTFNTTQNMEYD
jgi:hypothetical protein